MLLLIFFIAVPKHVGGAAVIKTEESDKFSPYFAAFSDQDKFEIAEYERLKRSLMHFKAIDWNFVVQPKITESEYSSS